MFGFIVGIGSLIGLAALRKRGFGCRHGGHWHGHHGRRHRPLWRLFEHLDTTPAQERLMRAEVERLWDRAHDLRRAGWRLADDLAEAIRADSFDAAAAEELLARHDSVLVEIRKELAGAVARVHEALDPHQRERLGRFMSTRRMGRGGCHGGPYRSAL